MRALCYALLLGLALSSCRATRPAPEPPRDYSHAEGTPYAPPVPRAPDSLSEASQKRQVADKRSLLHKLLNKNNTQYKEKNTSLLRTFINPSTVPRKCKSCTFNVVGGDQNNAAKKAAAGPGATTVTKPDAPVATAAGDATDNTKAGQRGGAAATAPNATATATTQKGGIPWWIWVVGAGLVGYGAVRLYKRFTPV